MRDGEGKMAHMKVPNSSFKTEGRDPKVIFNNRLKHGDFEMAKHSHIKMSYYLKFNA
jgi:hypothetical protein